MVKQIVVAALLGIGFEMGSLPANATCASHAPLEAGDFKRIVVSQYGMAGSYKLVIIAQPPSSVSVQLQVSGNPTRMIHGKASGIYRLTNVATEAGFTADVVQRILDDDAFSLRMQPWRVAISDLPNDDIELTYCGAFFRVPTYSSFDYASPDGLRLVHLFHQLEAVIREQGWTYTAPPDPSWETRP